MLDATQTQSQEQFSLSELDIERIEELLEHVEEGELILSPDRRWVTKKEAAEELGIREEVLVRMIQAWNLQVSRWENTGYSECSLKAILYRIAAEVEKNFARSCGGTIKLTYMHERCSEEAARRLQNAVL